MSEKCASPLRPSCGSTDIALYIYFGGRRLPICRRCWEEIASSDLQWGIDSPEEELAAKVEGAKDAITKRAIQDAFSELAERLYKRALRESKKK